MRPRLLDLFAGAGGAARGYQLAGFHVTGIDNRPQPRYAGDLFIQADALNPPVRLEDFDVIHASPPCQAYSITKHSHKREHPNLLPATREMLKAAGRPYVIENVVGAPMPSATELCGAAFGLSAYDPRTGLTLWLRRHRWFESNYPLMGPGACMCKGKEIGGVYGGGSTDRNHARQVRRGGYTPSGKVRRELMQIDWMTDYALTQAIPPQYTAFLGAQLMDYLSSAQREDTL